MKYYAQKEGYGTLRKIIADSDKEAIRKAEELFGTDKVIIGKSLQKGRSKQEQKEIYRTSEETADKMFGPHMKAAMQIMHQC